MIEIDIHLAIDLLQRNLSVLTRDIGIPIPAVDSNVAASGGNGHGRLAGQSDIEIGRDTMIAGAMSVRIHGHSVSAGVDQGLGARVPLVGIVLFLGKHSFTDRNMQLRVVGSGDVDRPVIVHYVQIRVQREVRGHLVIVAVALAKRIPATFVPIEIVCNLIPVSGRLRRSHPGANKKYEQKHSSCSNSPRTHSLCLVLPIFDQLDDAPKNDERRPVLSEPEQQSLFRDHVIGRKQGHDTDQNQYDRSGKGPAPKSRPHLGRASHALPHWWAEAEIRCSRQRVELQHPADGHPALGQYVRHACQRSAEFSQCRSPGESPARCGQNRLRGLLNCPAGKAPQP